jgi:hypothetical protein
MANFNTNYKQKKKKKKAATFYALQESEGWVLQVTTQPFKILCHTKSDSHEIHFQANAGVIPKFAPR